MHETYTAYISIYKCQYTRAFYAKKENDMENDLENNQQKKKVLVYM